MKDGISFAIPSDYAKQFVERAEAYASKGITVKPVLRGHSKRRPKIGFQDRLSLNAGHNVVLMQVILSTFIKLPFALRPLFSTGSTQEDQSRHD